MELFLHLSDYPAFLWQFVHRELRNSVFSPTLLVSNQAYRSVVHKQGLDSFYAASWLFFFTNQGCSSMTSKRLWLKRGFRKIYLKTCTDEKPKIGLAQFEVVHENVGFWCNWSEAVHTSTPDIWLYPEMKTCSNILRLTQTLKGPHVHTYYQRSMKGNIYIKPGAGNSGWSWIETLDTQRADGFSLDVTDTVRCRTYAQSDGNKGQKNPAVYRQTGITWRGFLTKRLNVL